MNQYFNMGKSALEGLAARGDYGASAELSRRNMKNNPEPGMKKDGTPRKKRPAGAAKAAREAKWSDKKKAFVERARKVMNRAREIMDQLGWYPGEAIRQAWAEEKAGKLGGYSISARTPASDKIKSKVASKGLKNNPFGYGYPF